MEMQRGDRRRLRTRRRRRRLLHGAVKAGFWALVLAGVFVLGLGYGKTLSGEDELRTDEVTITGGGTAIEATLPTETVTVTRTVRAPSARRGDGSGRRGNRS